MSATGSVNLIVCFSSSHPFAPREAENLQQLVSYTPAELVFPLPPSVVILRETLLVSRRTWARRAIMLAFFASMRNRTPGALPYHEDFETPGISPRSASPRKHKRQMPNLRRNARGRPQMLQRLCLRVENFGFFTSSGF
jgi:hypothetical protein